MRKTTRKITGLLLVFMLCLSLLPVSALATSGGQAPSVSVPASEVSSGLDGTAPSTAVSEAGPASEPIAQPTLEPAPESAVVSEPEDLAVSPPLTDLEPELVKVVEAPLVKVVYHYYDETQNTEVADFGDYLLQSSHFFYAATHTARDDASITITVNQYPGLVPVSTETPRFRVLLNDSEDITSWAAYDAVSGLLTLPFAYMGHALTVEWYNPASEIVSLPVPVNVSMNQGGMLSTDLQPLVLPSDSAAISLPIAAFETVVISQNGIELPKSAYHVSDGNLNLLTSPLGGEVTVITYAPGRARNAGGQVAHTRSEDTIFYGYYTYYFTANGNVSFCLNPTAPSIPTGSYPVSRYLYPGTDDLLIKCAYYLYGGPGYDAVKHNLFEDPDSLIAYALSHAAAAYAYLGGADAFHGVSAEVREHLVRVVSSVSAQAMPPQGFEAFLYNEGAPTQTFLGWNYAPTGNLEIVKATNNPDMTDGNPCYSLEGAVFDVYDSGNALVGNITTDANGRGRLDGLAAGSGYYLVETQAPKGYALSAAKVYFSIVSGQTETVGVTNIAQGDPVAILLQKRDAEQNTGAPQGGGTMEGALFTIQYYKGLYTAEELPGKTPARSWAVRTDADGFAMLHPDYLVSGDALYYDSSGRIATLPLGTVTVKETQAPAGYLLNSEVFVRHITAEGHAETVFTYNEPIVPDAVIRGGVSVEKWDFDLTRKASPQGDATLAGAVFEIYNRNRHSVVVGGKTVAPGALAHTMATDAAGTATTPNDLLPFGNYEIIEKTPPTGYLGTGVLRQTFSITSNGVVVNLKTDDTVIKNHVIRGGVEVYKWDAERAKQGLKQGDATLAGAVFEIWNRSRQSVVVEGREYAPNQVVYTLNTDENGRAATAENLLPYGSYEIIEKTPPTGYLNTGVIRQPFQIREHGAIVSLAASETVIQNTVIRGGVEVYKWDAERAKQGLKQGDATLAGAVFEIWNRSRQSVVVEGREYAPNQVVYTLITDENGRAATAANLLPYGSYEIIEKTPPTGYLNTGVTRQPFQIREHGVIVSLVASDTVIQNDVIRGGVRVEKWDNEIDEHRPQGGASLAGAVFEIVNRSRDAVLVQGVLYSAGEVVFTLTTDELGSAETPNDLLPYGSYEVRETAPPTGYLHTGVLSRSFTIREHGKIVELNTSETAVKNNPIRGDLQGVKISDGDAKRLANVPFSITSLTTGESHVVITDRNGEFSTASSWNPHSQNTNRGETSRDGVWFGELDTLNDDLGALLFDSYVLEELPCESNKGYELLAFEVDVYRHNTVIDLGTLTDDYIPVPEIFTTAMDKEMMANTAHLSETTTILDTVYYSGLKPGKLYTLKGVLMDKATKEPLLVDGEPVRVEKEFRATADSGSVQMEFTFDSTGIAGKSVVVFESLE